MIESRCGLHCTTCTFKEPCHCGGCIETNGQPFHGECPVAVCCQKKGLSHCGECECMPCELLTQYSYDEEHGDKPQGARIEQCRLWKNIKDSMIHAFNALNITDMKTVTDMHVGKGSFVNLQYRLPSGQEIKIWDDNKTYFINQICKENSTRCYGLVADEQHLLVCEYGDNGTDAEIIIYQRWK